jgi:hypothetical protein
MNGAIEVRERNERVLIIIVPMTKVKPILLLLPPRLAVGQYLLSDII